MYYAEDDQYENMATTERIPVELMRHFLNRGHVLYTDNFYTSPNLAKYYKRVRQHFLRENSRMTKRILMLKSQRRNSSLANLELDKTRPTTNPRFFSCFQLYTIQQWLIPEKLIRMKTDNQASDDQGIHTYNQLMGGVDRVDQQLHTVQALRKIYKWYKKLAFRLILQAALNAHKIFIEVTPNEQNKKLSFIDFLFRCVKQMVTAPKEPVAPRNDDISRLTGRYFRVMVPSAGVHHGKKRCRVCYARKIKNTEKWRRENRVHVRDCPSTPGLHPNECCKIYHTQLDYNI